MNKAVSSSFVVIFLILDEWIMYVYVLRKKEGIKL